MKFKTLFPALCIIVHSSQADVIIQSLSQLPYTAGAAGPANFNDRFKTSRTLPFMESTFATDSGTGNDGDYSSTAQSSISLSFDGETLSAVGSGSIATEGVTFAVARSFANFAITTEEPMIFTLEAATSANGGPAESLWYSQIRLADLSSSTELVNYGTRAGGATDGGRFAITLPAGNMNWG